MIRSRGSIAAKVLIALVIAAGAFAAVYYLEPGNAAKGNGAGARQLPKLEAESEAEQSTARLLFAQIVDDEPKDAFVERAILEGKPFKNLLKRAALKTCAELRAATDDKLLFEHLSDEADLHRGEAYTAGRGVVVEVTSVEIGPEYGFPPGWTVLPAVFINTAREVYALRFVCGPESKLFERLRSGIGTDQLPVINLSGLFFKNYARLTSDPKEKPWVKALLVCPEPEFPEKVEPRHVFKELEEAGMASLLPSQRIDAPGAEERLVVDVSATAMKCFGAAAGADANAFLQDAVARLKKRLPEEHVKNPSAVVFVRGVSPSDARVKQIATALKEKGVPRVFIKQDLSK